MTSNDKTPPIRQTARPIRTIRPPLKSEARDKRTDPLVSELAGMPEARTWAEGIVTDVKLYRAGHLPWSEIDAGCIFHGDPGTGKTTLARAIARSLGVPLISSSYSELSSNGRYGLDMVRGIRAVFRKADEQKPCVVAIDEIDSFPSRDGLDPKHVVTHQIVNALLDQLDGLNRREGVIVIGTCNDIERLDRALIRPGRLGTQIEIPLPDLDALPAILAHHLGEHARNVDDLESIAVLCIGMSGAAIEQLVRRARRTARRAGHAFGRDDLIAALEEKTRHRSHASEERIAVHEAGHALAAYRLFSPTNISLSLVSPKEDGGYTSIAFPDAPMTRRYVEDRLVFLLAGRAAEEVYFGNVSAGAGGGEASDLAQATTCATDAVARYGLSSTGRLSWSRAGCPHDLGNEVEDMLARAHERAVELFYEETGFLQRIADKLIECRTISNDQFLRLDCCPAPVVKQLLEAISGPPLSQFNQPPATPDWHALGSRDASTQSQYHDPDLS